MAMAASGVSLMEAISARLRRGDVTLERADSLADVIKLERADSSEGALSLTTGGASELRWHNAPIATYVSDQRLFRCGQCAVTAFMARPMAEHWLGAHADFKAFQCPHCPYMSSWQRCVRMHLVRHHGDRVSEVAEFSNTNVMADILQRLSELKRDAELRAPPSPADDEPVIEELVTDDGAGGKRHHCPYCPYSTHRRDLYNRHENIHKSDKPFQCYVCQRMFNRADHVKKHFLRIHRDDPYDVTRIRRIPPKTLTAQVYYSRAASLASAPPGSPEKPAATPPPPSLPPPPPPPPAPTPPAREEAKPLVLSPNPRVGVRRWAVSPPSSPAPTKRAASPSGDQKENRRQRREHSTPSESDASSGTETAEPAERGGRQGAFACSECPWRGFDSWCLKRHMNTHTKPYTCPLCPYKAARSERLTWHAAKVHAKKVCIKCFFVCDDQMTLSVHQLSTHQNGQSRQGFTCVMCAYTFKLHTELEAHMVAEHGRAMLDCSVCLFRTTDPAVLTDHVRYSHQQRPGAQQSPALPGGGGGAPPVILNVPSVRSESTASPPPLESAEPLPLPLPLPPPPPASPCEECRQVRPPLVCTHSGGTLRCQAARCRFEAGDAGALQAHVAARHADGALRCPHCAAPLGSVLEFSLHWPLHHVALCWSCAELTEQHFTILQRAPPPAAGGAAPTDPAAAIDCGSFLRLEMRTEEDGEEDERTHREDEEDSLFTGEEEDDESAGGERGAVKRSRKQPRPQRRPASPEDGQQRDAQQEDK